jgi:hypothetical protein
MFGILSGPLDSRQTTRLVLLAIILLTVPCYCLGAVLLAYAPADKGRTAVPTDPTLGGATASPGIPTYTPFLTATYTPYRQPLQPTPPQLYLPTNTPFIMPATWTPIPTWTFIPTITPAPTLTLPPPTVAPTITPLPTDTAVPTDVPPPPPTEVPPATEAPPPSPTQESLGGN